MIHQRDYRKVRALGAMLAALPSAAWAVCNYDTSGGNVAMLADGVCVPAYATYYGGGGAGALGPVYAGVPGARIEITQDTRATNTRGGGNGGSFYALNGADGNPAIVTSPPGVTLTSDTTASPTNTHGFRAASYGIVDIQGNAVGFIRSNQGRAMLVGNNGSITVHGDTELTVASTAEENSRALALEGTSLSARIELMGDARVRLLEDSSRIVNASAGGTLIIGGHLTAEGYAGKGGNGAVQTANGPIDIQLNTFEFTDVAGVGFRLLNGTNPTNIASTGPGVVRSSLDGFLAIRHDNPNGSITLGPGSELAMTGANATGVRLVAGARFAAGPGFTVDQPAAYATQTAFSFLGADQPITLADARIHAHNLWRSTDAATDLAFTANGGSYRGVAGMAAGVLALTLDQGARWEMTDDSVLGDTGQLTLAGDGVLDASVKGGPVTLDGDVLNQGGIVTLQQASASPADVLQTGAYTAGGGQLWLDTTLNDGAVSESDVLQVDEVLAGAAPTAIHIRPSAASLGAETTGQGILLVSVAGGPAASAPNAFTLAAPVVHNGYLYELVRDDGDGHWYLRSRLAPQPGSATVPVPVDAPWMLGLLTALLAGLGLQRRR